MALYLRLLYTISAVILQSTASGYQPPIGNNMAGDKMGRATGF